MSFATLSTGGFGTHNESVAFFDSVSIEMWIVVFTTLGSVNFMVYTWLVRQQWDRWRQDEATKTLLIVIGLSPFVILLDLFWLKTEASFSESVRQALLLVLSVISTTGYSTSDFGRWPELSEEVLLMLNGGCAGWISGGIKVGRWIRFFRIDAEAFSLGISSKRGDPPYS